MTEPIDIKIMAFHRLLGELIAHPMINDELRGHFVDLLPTVECVMEHDIPPGLWSFVRFPDKNGLYYDEDGLLWVYGWVIEPVQRGIDPIAKIMGTDHKIYHYHAYEVQPAVVSEWIKLTEATGGTEVNPHTHQELRDRHVESKP